MNSQQIFDRVAKHLAKQGRQCVNRQHDCRYRGPRGLKCAVGALITDREYKRSMEQNGVRDLAEKGMLPKRLLPFVPLLNDLQKDHDNNDSGESLVESLRRTALYNGISPAILDTLTFPEKWA